MHLRTFSHVLYSRIIHSTLTWQGNALEYEILNYISHTAGDAQYASEKLVEKNIPLVLLFRFFGRI